MARIRSRFTWRTAISRPRRAGQAPTPLDDAALRELALAYVARYATSRARLSAYLERKLKERGWQGDVMPDTADLISNLAELGYVDDVNYAAMKAASLTRRGYGARRLSDVFYRDGIAESDRAEALAIAASARWEAALSFARRKRIGCFSNTPADDIQRRRQFAAFLRAGHPPTLAQTLLNLPPGADPELYRPDDDA